jgi:hypothetical protein
MSNDQPYKWTNTTNGIGYVGIILLEVELKESSSSSEIIEKYIDDGYLIPAKWKSGIVKGLEYGLSKLNSTWNITLKSFKGSNTGTNPAIADYTALRALWYKVGFQPDASLIADLEEKVLKSFSDSEKDVDLIFVI